MELPEDPGQSREKGIFYFGQFAQADSKENIKAPHDWSLVRETTADQYIQLTKSQ